MENSVTQVSVPKVQTADRNTNQLQQNLITVVNQLQAQLNPYNNNVLATVQLIPTIVLAIGNNTINHTLGVIPNGYFIVSNNAVVSVYLVSSNTTQLILNASAIATISLLVF